MAEQTDEIVEKEEVKGADTNEEDKKSDKDNEEVPVRKSVLNAQRRIIESQAKKLAAKEEKDDEELTPKAQKLIEREVEKRLAPLASDIENNLLLRDYLSEHPEDKKYENQARRRMAAWPETPVDMIFRTLRPDVDAAEKTKAEEKANRASLKGSQTRAKEATVATTEAEYKEIYKNVKRGETGQALKKLGIQ